MRGGAGRTSTGEVGSLGAPEPDGVQKRARGGGGGEAWGRGGLCTVYEYRAAVVYRSPALPMGVLLKVFACEMDADDDVLDSVAPSLSRCIWPGMAATFGRLAWAEKP